MVQSGTEKKCKDLMILISFEHVGWYKLHSKLLVNLDHVSANDANGVHTHWLSRYESSLHFINSMYREVRVSLIGSNHIHILRGQYVVDAVRAVYFILQFGASGLG